MANPVPSSVYVELAPRSLKLLLLTGGKVSALRSFALDAKADLAAFVAENSLSGSTRASLIAAKTFLHVSSEEEFISIRQPNKMLEHTAKLPHGFEGSPVAVAVDAFTGSAPSAAPVNPWVLTSVDAGAFAAAKQHLTDLGLAPGELTLAAPIQLGAVVGSLADGQSALVVILGEEDSQLVWVSSAGLSQCLGIPFGYASIYSAIQQGLGLKFKAAAGKLFYNENYDFSGAVSKIVEPLAAVLKPVVDASPATFLHIVGLTDGQNWFVSALAEASGLRAWAPAAEQISAGLSGEEAKAASAGLFKLAAAGSADTAWVQATLDRIVAKAAAAKPASVAVPKPVPVPAPVVVPAPAPKSNTIPPVPPVAPVPKPAVKPPASAGTTAPFKSATTAPVKPATATQAPFPTKSAAPFPLKPAAGATRPPMPVKAPMRPGATPPVAVQSAPVAQTPTTAISTSASVAGPAKKSPLLIVGAVVAVAAVGGAVLFFRSSGKTPSDASAPAAASPVATNVAQLPSPVPAPKAPVVSAPPGTQDLLSADARKYKNDRYAFEVTEKGYIQALSGPRNEVLIESAASISLQGSYVGSDGRKKWFNVGGVDDAGYKAVLVKKLRDGITVFEVKVTHPRFEIEQVISCYPESVKVSSRFKPINLKDPRGVISAVHSLRLAPAALDPSSRMRPASDSFIYTTKAGALRVIFDPAVWARDGTNERQTIVAGENSVAFHFTESSDPAANQLSYEITMP